MLAPTIRGNDIALFHPAGHRFGPHYSDKQPTSRTHHDPSAVPEKITEDVPAYAAQIVDDRRGGIFKAPTECE